jgi:hypothetical protein
MGVQSQKTMYKEQTSEEHRAGINLVDIQRKPYLRRAATGITRRIVGGNVRADGMDPVWNSRLVGVLNFISTSFASVIVIIH